jgi:hypothetical protein
MTENRPNSAEAKRLREIEAGKARLANRQTVQSPVAAPAPAPVVEPDAPVTLNIPGVLDYAVGQELQPTPAFQTVVEDAPFFPSEPPRGFVEPVAETEPAAEPVVEPKLWTEDELREVAKQGIDDLRAIATPMGVKGRGKEELIREILAAQEPVATHEGEGTDVLPAPVVSDDEIDDLLND